MMDDYREDYLSVDSKCAIIFSARAEEESLRFMALSAGGPFSLPAVAAAPGVPPICRANLRLVRALMSPSSLSIILAGVLR